MLAVACRFAMDVAPTNTWNPGVLPLNSLNFVNPPGILTYLFKKMYKRCSNSTTFSGNISSIFQLDSWKKRRIS